MAVILVVCTANVCRSPLAAAILGDGLRPSLRGDTLTVLSAGTDAVGEAPVCPAVARHLEHRGLSRATAERTRSGLLDVSLVGAADLILTADRDQRAVVAQLSTAARARTFTLKEACYLAAGRSPQQRREAPADLPALAEQLNRLRGTVVIPGSDRSRRPFAGRRRHPLDIADGHQSGGKSHADTIHAVAAATERLAALLRTGAAVNV